MGDVYEGYVSPKQETDEPELFVKSRAHILQQLGFKVGEYDCRRDAIEVKGDKFAVANLRLWDVENPGIFNWDLEDPYL